MYVVSAFPLSNIPGFEIENVREHVFSGTFSFVQSVG